MDGWTVVAAVGATYNNGDGLFSLFIIWPTENQHCIYCLHAVWPVAIEPLRQIAVIIAIIRTLPLASERRRRKKGNANAVHTKRFFVFLIIFFWYRMFMDFNDRAPLFDGIGLIFLEDNNNGNKQ